MRRAGDRNRAMLPETTDRRVQIILVAAKYSRKRHIFLKCIATSGEVFSLFVHNYLENLYFATNRL